MVKSMDGVHGLSQTVSDAAVETSERAASLRARAEKSKPLRALLKTFFHGPYPSIGYTKKFGFISRVLVR
jgi:hypothetical protein